MPGAEFLAFTFEFVDSLAVIFACRLSALAHIEPAVVKYGFERLLHRDAHDAFLGFVVGSDLDFAAYAFAESLVDKVFDKDTQAVDVSHLVAVRAGNGCMTLEILEVVVHTYLEAVVVHSYV